MESFVAFMATMLPSKLLLLPLPFLSPSDAKDRRSSIVTVLLVASHALLFLFRLLVSLALSLARVPAKTALFASDPNQCKPLSASPSTNFSNSLDCGDPGTVAGAGAVRALSAVLSAMSRVPVWSRKYDLVRSLAERLIDDNARCGGSSPPCAVNRVALSSAFAATLRRTEAAVAFSGRADRKGVDGSVERIWGGVRSRLRKFTEYADEEMEAAIASGGEAVVEKMVAELLWLVDKMAACGAAGDAVHLWGSASTLAQLALRAEPRLQVSFVRMSVLLFKHANEMSELGNSDQAKTIQCQMAMLNSWLPLLCHATNGTDAPLLGNSERVEFVKVLEHMIEKLNQEQQEEILTLWLHHFSSCSHSDWPNLQACYVQWYSNSRKILMN